MESHFLVLGFLAFACQLLILVWSFHWLPSYEQRRITKARIRSYARLKGLKQTPDASLTNSTEKAEFEVLLGTLKKVEAKSSSLVAVLAFLLAFFLSATITQGEWGLQGALAVLLGLFLLLPLCFALQAMRQLDSFRFRSSTEVTELKLHEDLLMDLVRKERAFRFALLSTFAAIPLFVLPIGMVSALQVF